MCLNTCHCRLVPGAVATHWACPASVTGASITFHRHRMEFTEYPSDALLPPPQRGHLVSAPCVQPCTSTALLHLCSDCWQGRKPQLWMQGFCCLQAKQRKQLEMQVPVQMGGKQLAACAEPGALRQYHDLGSVLVGIWRLRAASGLFFCAQQNPWVSVSGEAGTPHAPARTQRAASHLSISTDGMPGEAAGPAPPLPELRTHAWCLGLSLCSNVFHTPVSFPLQH